MTFLLQLVAILSFYIVEKKETNWKKSKPQEGHQTDDVVYLLSNVLHFANFWSQEQGITAIEAEEAVGSLLFGQK